MKTVNVADVFIVLGAVATLVACFTVKPGRRAPRRVRRHDRDVERIIAGRYRQPTVLRGWHDQTSSTTSVRTLQACYGADVVEDPAAHATGSEPPAPSPAAHAGPTSRPVAAASPLTPGRDVEGRATTPVASGAVGRTSTGVTTGAARVG